MKNFQRILQLVKRTGNPLVILSEESENAFVLLPFEDYEATLPGKRNPREPRQPEVAPVEEVEVKVTPLPQVQPSKLDEEERFYLEPLE